MCQLIKDNYNLILNHNATNDLSLIKNANTIEQPKEALTIYLNAQKKLPDFASLSNQTIIKELGISPLECEKLLACELIRHHKDDDVLFKNTPFEHWHIFEKTVKVLNSVPANFYYTQEVTPAEITYSVRVMRTINQEDKFSAEVLKYICSIFHLDGFFSLPDEISRETSQDNISAEFFLNGLKKDVFLDEYGKIIQEGYLHSISDYCEYRQQKFNLEFSGDVK